MNSKVFYILCLYLFLLPLKCVCQEGSNWYFFTKNAIRFGTSPPTILTDSKMTESVIASSNVGDCTTMSDINGKLLFYSNSDSVWNASHHAMPNGFDLCTESGTGHVSFSIPFVKDANRYYIFQSAALNFTQPNNFYTYHIVNMSLNNGLGDVESKNDTIYLGSSDRLTAIKKGNGLDYWLLTHSQIGNTWKILQ